MDGVVSFRLGDRPIGAGAPCFVIAEAGVNHDGDPERARRLVEAAAAAGADAVKFQTFEAERLASRDAPKAEYQVRATGAEDSQLQMLRRLQLSAQAHRMLSGAARAAGIVFLSTPFDEGSADLLESLDVPAFKLPSGELTNLPLLAYVARKGRPLLVSTGMSDLAEVQAAVDTIRAAGGRDLALLHCVSCYPAAPADVNLRAMDTLAERFSLPVGFSDHTLGLDVAVAAVARGACVLEKHLTLDRRGRGPDHAASLEPDEFAALVRSVRQVEAALGHGRKEPAAAERDVARVARRSLVAAHDIPEGAAVTADAVTALRPGTGLSPALLPSVLGRRARRRIPAGTLLSLDMLA
jgi:N-acetylneuraminate synthase